MMGIMQIFRKNKKLVYFYRCWLHRNDEDYFNIVTEGFQNPNILLLKSFGNGDKGKIVYHITEKGDGLGFFAEMDMLLAKLYYADVRGFVPVVDWGNGFLYYQEGGIQGVYNAFEYFFLPVSVINSIEGASYVVDSKECHQEQVKKELGKVGYVFPVSYIEVMARIMKKYIFFNEKTKIYLISEYMKLLQGKKTIGVHFRGTDFHRMYNNHPVPVSVKQEFEAVCSLMGNGSYEQVFLATDEIAVVEKFREMFGNKLRVYEDVFRGSGIVSVAFSKSNRENHKYMLAREVLRDAFTLMQCEALVCGTSNVTMIARIMRKAWFDKDFESCIVIDNGYNHNNNYFWRSEQSLGKDEDYRLG